MILEIQALAKASAVAATEVRTISTTPVNGLTATVYEIDVVGRFFNVDDFVYRVHHRVNVSSRGAVAIKGRLFAVTSVQLSLAGSAGGYPSSSPNTVRATLQVMTFASAPSGGTSGGSASSGSSGGSGAQGGATGAPGRDHDVAGHHDDPIDVREPAMNRRYVIAGVTVVAVAGLWFMYNQSHSGGSTLGTVASSAAGGPRIPESRRQAGTVPTAQLYGVVTATTPMSPSGTLGSLTTFGQPRDAFVQIVGASTTPASNQSTAATSTTSTAPIQLGSGAASAVSGGGTGAATTPTTPVTPTTPTGQTLAAEFDINGEPVVAYDGDAIPPEPSSST